MIARRTWEKTSMVDIALAADHEVVLDGLVKLLELEPDFNVAGTASSSGEVAGTCVRTQPDILVVDLDMPGIDVEDIQKSMSGASHPPRIIVVTSDCGGKYAAKMLVNGVSAFALKSTMSEDLPGIIRQVAKGRTYVPEEMRQGVISNMVFYSRSNSK